MLKIYPKIFNFPDCVICNNLPPNLPIFFTEISLTLRNYVVGPTAQLCRILKSPTSWIELYLLYMHRITNYKGLFSWRKMANLWIFWKKSSQSVNFLKKKQSICEFSGRKVANLWIFKKKSSQYVNFHEEKRLICEFSRRKAAILWIL